MNLIEAIKSGKPFDGESPEDKGLVLWQDGPTGEAYLAKSGNFGDRRRLKVSDLCTNWEIQEPAVTITRAQLLQALSTTPIVGAYHMGGEAFNEIARKLGLGD